jgi:hypothetical protein
LARTPRQQAGSAPNSPPWPWFYAPVPVVSPRCVTLPAGHIPLPPPAPPLPPAPPPPGRIIHGSSIWSRAPPSPEGPAPRKPAKPPGSGRSKTESERDLAGPSLLKKVPKQSGGNAIPSTFQGRYARAAEWPSRREGALARTGLAQGQGRACVAVDPTAANALVFGLWYPESLKPTRSRAPFDEGSRNASREASHSLETVLQTAHLRSEAEFVAHPSRGGATFQPVPFGHPRFIRSFKIVWREAAPCSVVR